MDQMELRLSARRAVSELSQVIVENQAALQRSDMMKKEIDHRVMNSLQLASSLLAVQSHALGSSDAFEIAFVSILARRLKRLARDEVGAWRLRTASETRCGWIVLSNLYRKTCNEH
jgi:two-component sensor histidine kinase